jgi:uncharacterized small protein (DUF1192 family)
MARFIDPDAPCGGRVGTAIHGPTSLECAAVRVPQVSSLWTPGGEYPVDRDSGDDHHDDSGDPGDEGLDDDELRERAAAMQAEMDEVRAQLAQVPAAQVVANHAMGLFELAAIHLSTQPANLPEAVLAIDAMASLVEGLAERLGDAQPTLQAALAQIRMAFVQVKAAQAGTGEATAGSEPTS